MVPLIIFSALDVGFGMHKVTSFGHHWQLLQASTYRHRSLYFICCSLSSTFVGLLCLSIGAKSSLIVCEGQWATSIRACLHLEYV